MALDATNKVQAGGRVLIQTAITDAQTGLAPNPLPDVVTVHIFKPDPVTGYVEAAAQPMHDDTGGKYSTSFATPSDGPEGAWKTQIGMHFADNSTDLALKEATFWVEVDE
jgi:hypothetical protein